jgi:hypothetical protein
MHIDHFNLALPVLALALLIALIKLLRHLLHTPRRVSATSPSGQAMITSAEGLETTDPWERITSRWNRWITWVLPVPVGIGILALATWCLAYLGWGATWVLDRPTAMAGVPPWFGSAGLFMQAALFGLVTLFFGGAFGAVLVFFSHLIGKCLIWPEACGCEDDDASHP